MQYRAVARGEGWERRVAGRVLVHDVRNDHGAVRVDKGRVLEHADVERLGRLRWTELHVATLDVGDVHEDEAGTALACVAAGEGVPRPALDAATETARTARGLIRVRGFRRARLGAVVLESLGQRNPATVGRFGVSLGEKPRWFGAELVAPMTYRFPPYRPSRRRGEVVD